eukprot:XP_011412662.1 PREDICTED: uncharacterized protein LOC105317650 [Crassostrea gigas]
MADLRKEIDDVRHENSELKNTVNEMKVWMRSGQFSKNNDSDARIKTERGPGPRMSIQVANKRQKDHHIRSSHRINPLAPDVAEQPVAFYAYMESYSTSSLPIHTTLIFDTVQLNDGHGYSKHDGVFIAPRAGVYVFHWTIQVDIHAWASIEIVVNGTPIGKIEKLNSELREEKFIRRLELTDLRRQMDGIRRVNRELKEVNERPHGFISCIEHA